ncbi:hypothetical protein ACFC8N_24170 [Streptomyces sp. NPDC055966]|uniref:hypothetical protein n=1 Tax=unclassified Streptomyces TaxID=2593676 RepID=UPI0035DC93D9
MPHALNRRSFVGAAASFPGAAAPAPPLSAHGGGGQRHTDTNTKAGSKAALPAYPKGVTGVPPAVELPQRPAHRRRQGLKRYRADGTSPDRERSRSPLPAA